MKATCVWMLVCNLLVLLAVVGNLPSTTYALVREGPVGSAATVGLRSGEKVHLVQDSGINQPQQQTQQTQQQQQQVEPCAFQASDGSVYDLAPLKLPSNQAYNFTAEGKGDFHINVCGGTSVGSCTSSSAVCQSVKGYGEWSCGSSTAQSIADFAIGAPNTGVTLRYANGQACVDGTIRTTDIHLHCNSRIDEVLLITAAVEGPKCHYTIYAESPFACPLSEQLCQYTASDGSHFDLRSLALPDTGTNSYKTEDQAHAYFINICGNTAQGGCTTSTPVCQQHKQDLKKYALGLLSTQTFSDILGDEPAKGVSLTYSGGDECLVFKDERAVNMSIKCDLGLSFADGFVIDQLVEDPLCRYSMSGRARAACPTSLLECEYEASDGSHYNLQDMYIPQSSNDFNNSYTYSDTNGAPYDYNINICGVVNSHCSTPTPACQLTRGFGYFSLGSLNTQKFSDFAIGQANKGVTLTYDGGESCVNSFPPVARRTIINVACDPTSTPGKIVEVNEMPSCTYNVLIKSSFGCPLR